MPAHICYLNGQFLPDRSATVSILDRSFLYGDGLFETIRVSNGQPRHWPRHLTRLTQGARFLRIQFPIPQETLLPQALHLIHLNNLPEAILRLTLSRGTGPRGYSPRASTHPALVMTVHPAQACDDSLPPHWHLITSSIRVNTADPLTRFKTCNRLPYILAQLEADDAGANDALLLNNAGFVAESSCANLFWIHNDVLHTPPLASGPLDGITRSRLLQLAAQLNLPLAQTDARPTDLHACHGLFLTLSTRNVIPVATLDGQPIPAHPLIRLCHRALRDQND
jgi:branched-chain amino acid aminotransferase